MDDRRIRIWCSTADQCESGSHGKHHETNQRADRSNGAGPFWYGFVRPTFGVDRWDLIGVVPGHEGVPRLESAGRPVTDE